MTNKANLTIEQSRKLIHSDHRSRRHALLQITAPASQKKQERPSVNTSFIIDRSGSMGGGKLQLACKSVIHALKYLSKNDSFSVVTFESGYELVVAQTKATSAAKAAATKLVGQLSTAGSTHLSGGWALGCEQVSSSFSSEGLSRVMILTDGQANQGVTNHDLLCSSALERNQRGISTSTFGLGMDFEEGLLGSIAEIGGGAFYFIEDETQLESIFSRELNEALDVVTRAVKVKITTPAGCTVRPIGPYNIEKGEEGITILLPDLVANQHLSIPLSFKFKGGQQGSTAEVSIKVSDSEGFFKELNVTATWTSASSDENRAQRRDISMDRDIAKFYASRARREATQLNRQGSFHEANRVITKVADKIAAYAGEDPILKTLIDDLRREAYEFSVYMDSMTSKRHYSESTLTLRSKRRDGTSRRRGPTHS